MIFHLRQQRHALAEHSVHHITLSALYSAQLYNQTTVGIETNQLSRNTIGVSCARGSNRFVEKRTTDISARAEWIDRWMERIARAVRLGKIAGKLERRERRDGGSFLLDSRNVSISLIEGLSHGKRVNSIYSRVGGMARWTRTERREGERKRESVMEQGEGGCCRGGGWWVPQSPRCVQSPPAPDAIGFRAYEQGAEGIEEKGNDRERKRERGQSSLGFPLERRRRDAGLS